MSFEMLKRAALRKIIKKIRVKVSSTCIKCGSEVKKSKRKDVVICAWRPCKCKANVWHDTIFYRRKVPKYKILKIVELWMFKASYNLISYITRVDRKTIWNIMCKISNKLTEKYYKTCLKIGGAGKIIEIDES
jgi:hypothetical protein